VTTDRYEREAQFHDALADSGGRPADRFYAVNRSSWQHYRDLLLREAERARRDGDGRILEYGSGIGAYSSLALAEAGYPSIGVDISPGSVAAAAERAAREFPDVPVEYRVMNAEQLEFPDAFFDLVCGNGIIHHLDLDVAYAEIARVLKPGGVAVFAEPLGHNPLINLYRRLTPSQRTPDEHPLRFEDLALARTYFETVEARVFHFLVLAATPLHGTRAFAAARATLDRVDHALFDAVPAARRLAWYAVIRLAGPRAGGPRPSS
jgi:SAM-dependent methyltransferase